MANALATTRRPSMAKVNGEGPLKPVGPDSRNQEKGSKPLVRVHRGVTTEVRRISPQQAMAILDGQTDNRQITQARVEDYARQMREGRWMLNGEPIIFDWFDRLLDGQHRMWGVIESGVPVEFAVVAGVDPASFVTIDTGKSRDMKDLLTIRHEVNASVLAATLRHVWTYLLYKKHWGDTDPRDALRRQRQRKTGKVMNPKEPTPQSAPVSVRWGTKQKATPRELEEILTLHPEVREYVKLAAHKHGMLPPASVAFCWWLFAQTKNAARAETFFEFVSSGAEMKKNDPAFVLHRRFLQGRLKQARAPGQVEGIAIIIKCWNAWISGLTLDSIVWRESEVMPTVIK